jgi:hypothetical protein
MLAPKLTLFESALAVGAQIRQLDEHLLLTSSTHLVHPLTLRTYLCNNARYQIWYTPSGAPPHVAKLPLQLDPGTTPPADYATGCIPFCCETTSATGRVTLCSGPGKAKAALGRGPQSAAKDIIKAGARKLRQAPLRKAAVSPQYQVEKHYDDNDNYSDNDDVSRHPYLLSALLSEASLRPMPRIAQRPGHPEGYPGPVAVLLVFVYEPPDQLLLCGFQVFPL